MSGLYEPLQPWWAPSTLLDRLSDRTRGRLLAIGAMTDFAPGQRIIRAGETRYDVFLLLSGYVKITIDTEQGETALLAIRMSGDMIGEMSAIDGCARSATAIACSAINARVITRPDFLHFLYGHPDAAMAVSRMISERLRWANRRRVDITTLDPPARIQRILIEIARIYCRPNSKARLEVPLTQPEIASMAGVSLRSVEKELRRLQARQLISRRYGRTEVLDLRRLAEAAGGAEA